MDENTNRDQPSTLIRYFDPDAPRDETVCAIGVEYTGLLTLGEAPGASKEDYKKRRDSIIRQHAVTVRDARTSRIGGLTSWKFEVNGFTFVPAPAPVENFQDHACVCREYAPRLLELVKATTGANRAFVIGQQVRSEQTGRGTSSSSYARFAHSDYGPEFEPLFRRLLAARYGLPEEEATSCGICCAGFWAPIERPAYKDPLCLLDCSSVDMEKDMIRYIYQGDLKFASKRQPERLVALGVGPQVAQVVFGLFVEDAVEGAETDPRQRVAGEAARWPAGGSRSAGRHGGSHRRRRPAETQTAPQAPVSRIVLSAGISTGLQGEQEPLLEIRRGPRGVARCHRFDHALVPEGVSHGDVAFADAVGSGRVSRRSYLASQIGVKRHRFTSSNLSSRLHGSLCRSAAL